MEREIKRAFLAYMAREAEEAARRNEMQLFYGLTFDDGQKESVKNALTHYLDVCRREIMNGATVPFIAHSVTIPPLRAKLAKDRHACAYIDISEMTALEDAISSYLETCEHRIAKGQVGLFIVDRSTLKVVTELLHEAVDQAFAELMARVERPNPDP